MAKILTILTIPNQILRKKSEDVSSKKLAEKKLQALALNMVKTMKERDGVGLAAPQVGENIRLITVNTKDGVLILFNPKITKNSFAKEWAEEGCLSVPGVYGKVRRNKKINCVYFNISGEKKKISAEGLLARVIQHEIDHLDGILFIDKAKDIQKADSINL
ncbi:MAG: peptide deformylase [Patescibacteria group bacterium]|nr:peptide deformylase [Patescibacteria group bacterium]MDD4611289.1 peptide deformylase [Patescibacteria group bacterium]